MKFSSVISLGLSVALSLASRAHTAVAAADVDHDEKNAAVQAPENESEARPANLRGAEDRKLPGLFDDGDDRRVYILSFKGKSDDAPGNGPGARCDALARAHGGTTGFVYDRVLNGCSMRLPPAAARALQKNPQIARLEEDQVVVKSQTINNPLSWGLDRIDQANLPLDQVYEKVSAAGVRVYILDTGLNGGHADFVGMLGPTSSSSPTFPDGCHVSEVNEVALNDGDGHGTHVGSTTCGLTYGVASGCELCAVQVLDSTGSGSYAGVIAGIEHAVNNCNVDNTGNGKCVLNMSLGGPQSDFVNQAVAAAVGAGVVAVVAAGNESTDACNSSPASELSAITVGSTTISDVRSSFSNSGDCVDVYAPGSGITAAWIGSTTSVTTISGTSMASPHVAGIAAAILSAEPTLTPAQVSDRIKASSTNTCTGCDPNRLANTLGVDDPSFTFPPTPSPLPVEPTIQADFDGTTPRCAAVGGACSSGPLYFDGRGALGPEDNSPNTIDGCVDGNTGTYHVDESNDAIEVAAFGGGLLEVGRMAVVRATVWAWSTGSSDTADFYVTDGAPSNPTWSYKGSKPAAGGGSQVIESDPFVLTSELMTARVRFRYQGSANPCQNGGYDDIDDIVFAVSSGGTQGPTPTPTRAPTNAPIDPTRPPSAAPTQNPTAQPTNAPIDPTLPPSAAPTQKPTAPPTNAPSTSPSKNPTSSPSTSPSKAPSRSPSKQPTNAPIDPTLPPSAAPTQNPTAPPTNAPSTSPSKNPTSSPSTSPSKAPSSSPTKQPTNAPVDPTAPPTKAPTIDCASITGVSNSKSCTDVDPRCVFVSAGKGVKCCVNQGDLLACPP